MTVHQCPKCELRFDWKTELEDHCWHDHPEFRHDYPATVVGPAPADEQPVAASPAPERRHHSAGELFAWLRPDSGSGSSQRKPG